MRDQNKAVSEVDAMHSFASALWNRFLKRRVQDMKQQDMLGYRAEVVTNNGNGTLTVQRPFETTVLTLKCAGSMASTAVAGDQVLICAIGGLSNAFILCFADLRNFEEVPDPYTSNPNMDGTASPGGSNQWSRGDHVHPSDTSKQNKIAATGILKGNGSGNVGSAVAGTDYATPGQIPSPSSANPQALGTAAPGSSTDYSRADHVHQKPTYTNSDVGLGNVDNVKQYSASNPPPYPVTSVNGSTGAVTVSVPTADTNNPEMDGTASPGSSGSWARGDHVHPSDTSKQDTLNFDNTPIQNSNNPVTSGGVWSAQEILAQINNRIYQGVDLTVKFSAEIAASPYSGDPWAWIKARIAAGNYAGIHVGDYIPITTTEATPKTYNAQIMGIDTYTGYSDTAVGHHIDWCCNELWNTRHPVNKVNHNNGTKFGNAAATEYPWIASDLYLWLNSLSGTVASATSVGGGTGTAVNYTAGGVYYYLPSALKTVIVQKRAYLPKRYDASSLLSDDNAGGWANIGKLWLPSEWEVYGGPVWGGTKQYSTLGNCIQYPIFQSMANRVKKRSGSPDAWWVLSACSGNTTNWCLVAGTGNAGSNSASFATCAAPVCFRIS